MLESLDKELQSTYNKMDELQSQIQELELNEKKHQGIIKKLKGANLCLENKLDYLKLWCQLEIEHQVKIKEQELNEKWQTKMRSMEHHFSLQWAESQMCFQDKIHSLLRQCQDQVDRFHSFENDSYQPEGFPEVLSSCEVMLEMPHESAEVSTSFTSVESDKCSATVVQDDVALNMAVEQEQLTVEVPPQVVTVL